MLDQSIIFDEVIYQKGLGNSDIHNLLKTYDIVGEIFADAAEPKSIAELRRYGHKIKGAKKGRDSINFGISILQSYEIKVTKRSINVKDELDKYTWKKEKDGTTSNIPIDAFNHTIDAVRYLAVMKLGKKNSGAKTFRII